MEKDKRKVRVATLSVASNSALVLLKLVTGLAMGSISVISEAVHSGVDLLAALIALFAVRTSGKPADSEHPFGHGKIENLSGTIEALLIFLAAGWIIWEAVRKLVNPNVIEAAGWGVGVMVVSSVVNWVVSHMLFKVGNETDSVALKADAWHLRTDVYTSMGVMVGLGLIWGGGFLFPGVNLNWLDPVAALLVAVLILKAAYDLTVQSGHDLIDGSLPPEEEEWIRGLIAAEKGVKGHHKLRTRKAGAARFVEFHIFVDPGMTTAESHRITQKMQGAINDRLPGATVTIHVEPFSG